MFFKRAQPPLAGKAGAGPLPPLQTPELDDSEEDDVSDSDAAQTAGPLGGSMRTWCCIRPTRVSVVAHLGGMVT